MAEVVRQEIQVVRHYDYVTLAHIHRKFSWWLIYNDWHWGNDGIIYAVEVTHGKSSKAPSTVG